MAPISKISESICLIKNPGDKRLSINEEARKILENISQPLVVVSIVGPYRSGKSYLLNKLSGDSGDGFSLGHTLSANTKGIWMRCVPHPKKSNHTLILLDTEGVGDVAKADQDNDCIILSLAMLMSSAVIYNSKATIDQDAVKKLHSMTRTHQYITEKATKHDGQDVQMDYGDDTLPLLVWTLRDATLKLELKGRPVTADEYLENCLRDLTIAKTPRTREQNDARKTIRKFFPKRKCFVFDIPSSDKEILSKMGQVSETTLQPRFVEETKHFCQFVLEEVPPKALKGGLVVTGSRFAHLLQSYLEVVRRQDIRFLEHSLSDLFNSDNNKIIKSSIEGYENKMSSHNVNSRQEFQLSHEAAMEEAVQEFNKSYVEHEKSRAEYQDELKTVLMTKKDEIWKMCEDSSLQKCNDIKAQLESRLQQNLKENKYHVSGGYKTFVTDKESAIQEYCQEQDKGVKAEDVLQDFLSSLAAMEEGIVKTHQDSPDAASKIFQVTDTNNDAQLIQYINNYQLPPGRFSRILIQLFGFAGHGKSSFVNSCLFALSLGSFHDYAGEATSQGGKTVDRRGYQLTNCITIVDNRGFSKMNSAEEWEIYAQLCHFVPLNKIVSWAKSQEDRIDLLTQGALEPSDVIVPVLIYSSQKSLTESDSIKEFLKQAQKLTGILPFIILTKSKMVTGSTVKNTFSGMGMEYIYCIENYILSDHHAQRRKHLSLLNILYDILQCVNYFMKTSSNFQNQRNDWLKFLMRKAGTI